MCHLIRTLFVFLCLVERIESSFIRQGQAAVCTWKGHCAGDRCSTYNDCDGALICVQSKCAATANSGATGNDKPNSTCSPSGQLRGVAGACNTDNMSTCCKQGILYPQYKCSPTSKASSLLTLNSFQEGGDGGYGGACYNKFYSDRESVVALSTGWYNGSSRCGKTITIKGNGRTTRAVVVDECDSVNGCDAEHAGQPPCRNNIVDGSPAVWAALGISSKDPRYGEVSISWTD